MTRIRSLLHAGAVFAAILAVGFMLTTAGVWLTALIFDGTGGMTLTVAAVGLSIAALGTIASAGIALVLAATTYAARRKGAIISAPDIALRREPK